MSVFSFDRNNDDDSQPESDASSNVSPVHSSDGPSQDVHSDSSSLLNSSVDSNSSGTLDESNSADSFESIVAAEFGTSPDRASYVIARDLYEARSSLDRIRAVLRPKSQRIKDIVAEMNALRDELNKKIRVLDGELLDLKDDKAKLEGEEISLEHEVTELKRLLEMELQKERASDAFHQNVLRFDEITSGMAWREFAFSHQIEGAKIMANNHRTILADKMGLGKTLSAIIASDMAEAQRVLVVAPADVCNNWAEEWGRWAPHRMVFNLYKQPRNVRDAFTSICKNLVSYTFVVNYEAWRSDPDLLDDLIALRFDTVILDEAHIVKNTSTSAFQGCKKIILAENSCPRCGAPDEERQIDGTRRYYSGCIRCSWDSMTDRDYKMLERCCVKNVFPMTGTPILNKPQELYSLLHLLMPEIFHQERVFLEAYCVQDPYHGYWSFRPGALERLSQHLAGKYVARTKEMVGLDIPDAIPQYHEIPFDTENYPNQWRIIQQLSKHAQIILDSGKELNVLATITLILRKRQANVWPGGIVLKDADGQVVFSVGDEVRESLKVDWAVDKIVDTEGERAVVFSQFTSPLHEIRDRLSERGISAAIYDGSTPTKLREEIRKDFDRKHCDQPGYEKKWQVILCNYKTGGVGLNLTGATLMVVLDEEWNPGKNEQAWNRIARIGQTGKPQIHILRIERTIDTWMAALNDFKAEVVGGFETKGKELSSSLLDAMKNGDII